MGNLEKIALRFVVFALLFFGLSGIEGMMMRLTLSNVPLLEADHFYAVLNAHPIVGIFGYGFMMVMGAFYYIVPTFMQKKLYSEKLANINFIMMVAGVLVVWCGSFFLRYSALYTNYWPLPVLRSTPLSLTVYTVGLALIMGAILIFCFNLFATFFSRSYGKDEKPLSALLISAVGLDGLINLFNRVFRGIKQDREPAVSLPLVAIFRGTIDTVLDALVLGGIGIMFLIYAIPKFFNIHLSTKAVDALIYKNIYWWGLDLIADGLVLIYVAGAWYLLTMLITKRSIVFENFARAALFIELIVSWNVWSHHLLSDQPQPLLLKFMSGELITAFELVTTGIAIFCCLTTLWISRPLKMTPPLKFLLGGITGFSLGAVAGIVQADIGVNRVLHNTQWVIGPHAHMMVLIGLSFTLFAAMYALLPLLAKVELKSNFLVNVHFWFNFIGALGMSISMGYAGLGGMLRRTLYFGDSTFLPYMHLSTFFGLLILVGYAAMMINILYSVGVMNTISLFLPQRKVARGLDLR